MKKFFHTMKVNNEKAIAVKICSKWILQHVDKKPLKGRCDIDDKNDSRSQLQEPLWQKCKPLCVPCNQAFAMKNGLTKVI